MSLLLANCKVRVLSPAGVDSHDWSSEDYVEINPPVWLRCSIQPAIGTGDSSGAMAPGSASGGPGDPGQSRPAIGYMDPSPAVVPGTRLRDDTGTEWQVESSSLVRGPEDPALDVLRLSLARVEE